MTRQEAVEIIREHGVSYIPRNTEIFTQVDAAWTVAIKALEEWDNVLDELEAISADPGVAEALNIIEDHMNEMEN